MAKFRIRLKVQALELEIDGEREDIPALTSAIRQQFGGFVEPAELIADDKQLAEPAKVIEANATKNATKPPRKRTRSGAPSDGAGGQAIEFRHDSAKYGNPLQAWDVTTKLIWLLAVIKGITGMKEVSGPQLTATFNQYFKQAGKIHPPHVPRDLGRAKVQNPSPLVEDKGLWSLTTHGESEAQKLIQSLLNSPA
jgi:hypothetical protein